MDIRSNEPFWLIKNALLKSYPSLRDHFQTDILVIGGGITGALIAYSLVKEGFQTMLVDRRDIANGSTAASTAMLQYEIDVPLHKLIRLRGPECAVQSYKYCEKAIFELESLIKIIGSQCGFQRKKSIYFAGASGDIAFLQKEFRARKEHGFEIRWLEPEELWKSGLDSRGAIESVSGAVMDPYKLTNDLLSATEARGLRIFDKTEIRSIRKSAKGLECITERDFVIRARHVVHCSGYESRSMLKEKVADLKSTYALASEQFDRLPEGFRDRIYWNTSDPYLYFRGTGDRRIIIGGGDEKFKNGAARDQLLAKKEKSLADQFHKCFPGIEFKTDYSWAGTFGETRDGLPYMGIPGKLENQHYILGFGGNGITFSVMGMEAVLASIKGLPHDCLKHYRFKR